MAQAHGGWSTGWVPFYLYIDEFQNFASESFKVVLSEARKCGLSLTMAHQSLSQIPDDLRGLILGSAGVQVYFRMNRQDAQLLAKEAFEYSGYRVKLTRGASPQYWSYAEEWEHKIEELQHLPPRGCYVKHKIEGGIIPIRTADIESPCEMLGSSESEYAGFLTTVPIGRNYLHAREDLRAQIDERRSLLEQADERPEEEPEASPAERGTPPKPRQERPVRTRTTRCFWSTVERGLSPGF